MNCSVAVFLSVALVNQLKLIISLIKLPRLCLYKETSRLCLYEYISVWFNSIYEILYEILGYSRSYHSGIQTDIHTESFFNKDTRNILLTKLITQSMIALL